MKIPRLFVLAIASVIATAGAQASFVLIDDFQEFSVGNNIRGQQGWRVYNQDLTNMDSFVVADPQNAANRALNVFGTANTLGKNNVKEASIPNGELGQLQFQFYTPTGNNPDISIGMSQVATPAEGTHINAGLRIHHTSGTLQLYAWDNATARLLTNLSKDTWYTVQMDILNNVDSINEFGVSIVGGAFENWTQLSNGSDDTFSFRNATIGNAFVNFNARANNSHHNQNTYFDNIAMVPEPGLAAALLGLGCLLLVTLRRRRS